MPSKERAERFIKEGRCRNCGRPHAGIKVCEICRQQICKASLKKKRNYIEQGKCRECGMKLPTPEDGTVTCPKCTLRPRFDKLFK